MWCGGGRAAGTGFVGVRLGGRRAGNSPGGRKSGPRKCFAGKFAQFSSLFKDFSEFLTFPKVKNMRFLQKRVFFNFFDVKNAFNEI